MLQHVSSRQLTAIRNIFIPLFGRGLSGILDYFVLALIGRALGIEEFGQYVLLIAWAALFEAVSDFGLRFVVVKYIALEPSNLKKYLSLAWVFRTISFFVLGTIAILVSPQFLSVPPKMGILVFLVGVTRVDSDPLSWMFRGLRRRDHEMWGMLLSSIALVLLVFLCSLNRVGLLYYLIAIVLSNLIRILYGFIFLYRMPALSSINFEPIQLAKTWATQMLPLGTGVLLTVLYLRSGMYILDTFSSISAVGLYGAGVSLVRPWILVVSIITLALYPGLSKAFATGTSPSTKAQMYMGVVAFIGSTFALALYFSSEVLIRMIFADEFVSAIQVTQILAAFLSFSFLNFYMRYCLTAANLQIWDSVGLISGVAFFWVFGIIAAKNYGAMGIAIIYCAAEVITLIVKLFGFRSHLSYKNMLDFLLLPILVVLIPLVFDLIFDIDRYKMLLIISSFISLFISLLYSGIIKILYLGLDLPYSDRASIAVLSRIRRITGMT